MMRDWTFGRKLGASFALTAALSLSIGLVGIYALDRVVISKDQVIALTAQNLIDLQRLAVASARKSSALRGYLLSKQPRQIDLMRERRRLFLAVLPKMRERVQDPEARRLLDEAERLEAEHEAAAQDVIAMKRADAPPEQIVGVFDQQVQPKLDALVRMLDGFMELGERALVSDAQAATATAESATRLIIGMYLIVMALKTLFAVFLTRTLGRQIGTAIGQVQSSSAELQATANQQATATKEQATAMSEITTTITELLATSRQIAESARRVAQIAEQTASSARAGDTAVQSADHSIVAIRRQVDLIVSHMLELGKKSQQIGAVLEIVAELAEQTNILAINASIEAAGAGDAGKRFSVVADEIRKLADRVAGSTKDIRKLIEDVRSSANTTIMTTEAGSKAVEAGARQFAELRSAFTEIVGMVGTTTEAAREIELSTKQQATAVEQVNIAVTSVALATKETEASSGQLFQTAGQLNGLSRELLRLVESQQSRPQLAYAD